MASVHLVPDLPGGWIGNHHHRHPTPAMQAFTGRLEPVAPERKMLEG